MPLYGYLPSLLCVCLLLLAIERFSCWLPVQIWSRFYPCCMHSSAQEYLCCRPIRQWIISFLFFFRYLFSYSIKMFECMFMLTGAGIGVFFSFSIRSCFCSFLCTWNSSFFSANFQIALAIRVWFLWNRRKFSFCRKASAWQYGLGDGLDPSVYFLFLCPIFTFLVSRYIIFQVFGRIYFLLLLPFPPIVSGEESFSFVMNFSRSLAYVHSRFHAFSPCCLSFCQLFIFFPFPSLHPPFFQICFCRGFYCCCRFSIHSLM